MTYPMCLPHVGANVIGSTWEGIEPQTPGTRVLTLNPSAKGNCHWPRALVSVGTVDTSDVLPPSGWFCHIYTRGNFATSNSMSHMFTFLEGLPSIDTFFILQLPVRVLSVYVYPYVPSINASTKSERPSAIERLTAHGPDLQVEFDVFCDINCLSWG